MINETFFNHVKLLKEKYSSDNSFNLFSVLRSESDEVRLHSRFLAEILNPQGTHGMGNKFLNEFLRTIDIPDTSFEKATTHCEYKNIDILVRSEDTAIIIENKIFAGDQEKQLQRYYETMLSEGSKDIHILYLTLDGAMPSAQSIGTLVETTSKQNRIKPIDYKDTIYSWIEKCLAISAREPALRESFSQYLKIIESLTSKLTNENHMKQLKTLLLKDDNLLHFQDLQQAYNALLIDFQTNLWHEIQKELASFLGGPDEKSISSDESRKSAIKNFMEGRQKSRFFGLFYPQSNQNYQIAVEMQHDGIIAGIACDKSSHPEVYEKLLSTLSSHNKRSSDHWPCYQYIEPKINYRNLTPDCISKFISEEKQHEIACKVAEHLRCITITLAETH